MEKLESYYDWEQSFKKRKAKEVKIEPKDTSIINSIGLPHGFFKSYLKLWKSYNMVENKSQ